MLIGGASLSQAHDHWSKKSKFNPTSDPVDCPGVQFRSFTQQEGGKTFVHGGHLLVHPALCRNDERGEWTVLHLTNAFPVSSPATHTSCNIWSVGCLGSSWQKGWTPLHQRRPFPSDPTKSVAWMSTLVSSVVIVLLSECQLLYWQCLERWFHGDAMAYLRHEAGCDVPQLIVPDYGEATRWAAQGMPDTEWLSTFTVWG